MRLFTKHLKLGHIHTYSKILCLIYLIHWNLWYILEIHVSSGYTNACFKEHKNSHPLNFINNSEQYIKLKTWVWSLGQEDSLEKGMATHSSVLAWRIPWTEEPGGLQPMGSYRAGHDWVTFTHSPKFNQHLYAYSVQLTRETSWYLGKHCIWILSLALPFSSL